MTNPILSTFLYANSIGLSETKIDYGARLEYQLKPKYSIGVQVNNHANDSAIDGADIYGTRQFYTHGKWTHYGFGAVGSNIEDSRMRSSLGFGSRYRLRKPILAEASVGYQREWGGEDDWKGERIPNAMITQLGIGLEF